MAENQFGSKVEETFSITVKDDKGEVVYENEKEPFSWYKVDSLVDVLRSEGLKLTDDQIAFLGEALKGDDSEDSRKAVLNVIEVYNKTSRANAKNNRYQSVMNQYKPISEEDAAKAFERMVETFAKLNKVSVDVARKTLAGLQPATA